MLPPMPREWLFPGTSDGICSLQRSEDSITTQFPMGILEELDFSRWTFWDLGLLRNKDAVALIKKNHNIDVKIDELQMDDPNVFKLIGEGRTAGVFQLESAGMTQFMKELQPASLEDIIAGISCIGRVLWIRFQDILETKTIRSL